MNCHLHSFRQYRIAPAYALAAVALLSLGAARDQTEQGNMWFRNAGLIENMLQSTPGHIRRELAS